MVKDKQPLNRSTDNNLHESLTKLNELKSKIYTIADNLSSFEMFIYLATVLGSFSPYIKDVEDKVLYDADFTLEEIKQIPTEILQYVINYLQEWIEGLEECSECVH